MIALGVAVSLLWSTHFLLLGATTGAAMNLLSAGRGYVYYRVHPNKRNTWVLWLFVGLTAIATALTWQGMISLLPFAGSLSSVVAFWHRKPKMIRRLAFLSSPPWLTYNIIVGSYPGIVVEILLMASNLIGQYRFDLKHPVHHKLLRVTKPV